MIRLAKLDGGYAERVTALRRLIGVVSTINCCFGAVITQRT